MLFVSQLNPRSRSRPGYYILTALCGIDSAPDICVQKKLNRFRLNFYAKSSLSDLYADYILLFCRLKRCRVIAVFTLFNEIAQFGFIVGKITVPKRPQK